ncbi:basement membrane-specific heparan sulfate proteoglycan core protein-like [Neoarius graeffei]|uniref:basement membrane-specific heparan sulfate proteoglycan core protein-like n=1 Tax=Neoarius graeffei TaxID=443677 RepID=UPI00298C8480|nr:basement membrane-specific heparan sulfate proteoglycan core protein-like [Neoarius graeffei]
MNLLSTQRSQKVDGAERGTGPMSIHLWCLSLFRVPVFGVLESPAVVEGSAKYLFLSVMISALAQKPVVSIEPRSIAIKQDDTVSFRCRVTSGAQPVQLEWKRPNNQPLPDNVKVGPDGSVLTIAFARPGNQGQYRCVATNAQGKATMTATLTVKQPPKVRVTPASQVKVKVGGVTSLVCHASGKPRPSITWFKQEAGKELLLVSTTTGSSLTVKVTVAAPQDGGTFVCRAQNKDGTAEEKVELKVEGRAPAATPPTATVLPTDVIAVEGQTVTIYCQATGSPTPVITWSKLRAPLPWQHKAEGGTLTLSSVGRQDSGQYICNATNSAGFSEAYAQMEVDTPPYATTVPDHVTARRGDSMRIQCIAHGSHPISFHWTRAGGAAMPSGAKITKEGVLTIAQLKVNDSGKYKCEATNHVGKSETFTTVTVRGFLMCSESNSFLNVTYFTSQNITEYSGFSVSCQHQ